MSVKCNPKARRKSGSRKSVPLALLLQRIWTYALTTKSDPVRSQADLIAEAASKGYITTQIVPGSELHGRLWKITEGGLSWLRQNATLIATTEETRYVERH